MEKIKYEKFYCKYCGRWLGLKRPEGKTDGILPYCSNCKTNVEITTKIENTKQ